MLKGLLVCAIVVGGVSAASAQSTYLHSHYHASHHYHMMYGRHHHHVYNGVGFGENHRTTATGGNPGGYSSRN